MSTETEILAEVETLKGRFSDTKALYREVCALLFFRYGLTPTANKLYQYVRKGTMSTPAEALAKFWDDLRTKAR
ncbi:DNA-binding protein, partial [Klebsiella pneumoniae]|nr:DNA-binding protein [Klebsiella pneumoniae]